MSLSIIVCATKPDLVRDMERNIAETIGEGAVYEVIAIDNTVDPKPIAAVYNEGGRRARYDNLLFLHQDAGFVTRDWLPIMEAKLREPDCGAIGFAGTKVFYNFPAGWAHHGHEWIAVNYFDGKDESHQSPDGKNFSEVVAIDGFAMFVRKDVWAEYPFDEKELTDFHCYDLDFSLTLVGKYKNYVCCNVMAYHLSPGNFNKRWADQTERIYNRKWSKILPLYSSEITLDDKFRKYKEERVCFRTIRQFHEAGLNVPVLNKRFLSFPMTPRHLEHLIKYACLKLKDRFKKK